MPNTEYTSAANSVHWYDRLVNIVAKYPLLDTVSIAWTYKKDARL